MIQSSFDQIGLRLGELIQWLFLGQILSNEAIGVLIGAPLPGFVLTIVEMDRISG
jgi:hypothetical protein